MPLIAVPNVSEGRDGARIDELARAATGRGARLLDVHSDAAHNRSVLTLTGAPEQLVAGMTALADACRVIDLTGHVGIHPRLGCLDVCPFVPYRDAMSEAVDAAHETAAGIGALALPVFLYGVAAHRAETRELPDLRRGGLDGLAARIAGGLVPDHGPSTIDPRDGVVCVGARGPLIAFNVWLKTSLDDATEIAAAVRRRGSVRALALPIGDAIQISMNLTDPVRVGIDAAFAALEEQAAKRDATVRAAEIIGLVEERFLPNPDAEAARLLIEPGRSLESALSD